MLRRNHFSHMCSFSIVSLLRMESEFILKLKILNATNHDLTKAHHYPHWWCSVSAATRRVIGLLWVPITIWSNLPVLNIKKGKQCNFFPWQCFIPCPAPSQTSSPALAPSTAPASGLPLSPALSWFHLQPHPKPHSRPIPTSGLILSLMPSLKTSAIIDRSPRPVSCSAPRQAPFIAPHVQPHT